MSITLAVGNTTIDVSTLTDLESSAQTLLNLAPATETMLGQAVSQFPAASSPITLKYTSGNNTWSVGNFSFGLSGSVSGSISILGQGKNLLTYTNSFATTVGNGLGMNTNSATTDTIVVPNGAYYVQVSLDFTITANAAANVPLGAVGIQGSVGTSDTFVVTFSKKVDGGRLLKDALVEAFADFVLPLHNETYQKLQPGDYLYHQFNATLNVGFGATYGLNQVYFSGQYKADIPSGPAALSVNTSGKLEVQAGATFSATFKYTGSFEAMLWKTDDNTGCLHLYKSQLTDTNFQIGGSVTVIADPKVTVPPVSLQTLATQVFPGETGTVVGNLLSDSAQSQVASWVSDVQAKLTSWLKPFQQGKTQLELAIDDTSSRFLLLNFMFNLTAAGFSAAWNDAIQGDFCATLAVPTGGASLDAGSGLEYFHTQKTSVSFNLFGVFTAEWSAANIDNYNVLYAGNNRINLIQNIGRAQITTLNKSGKEIDFYFAAGATGTPAGAVAGEADLHVVLTATQNKGFGAEIAGLLSNTTTGTVASALSKQMLAVSQQGSSTVALKIVFKPSAYSRLSFSKVNGGEAMNSETADESNFKYFALACAHVETSSPANFSTKPPMDYPTWRTWNIAADNAYPPPDGSGPDRRDTGDLSAGTGYLDQQFGDSAPPALIGYAFLAASDFMNLCEDLTNLTNLAAAGTSWQTFLNDLKAILENDLAVDFIPATALALAECLGQPGVTPQIVGPSPTASQESTITVTLQYS